MIQSDTDLIRFHEGCTLTAKPDAKSKWSIGWGHDIAPVPAGADDSCSQAQADEWLDNDLRIARARAQAAFEAQNASARWSDLDPVRQAVLTDMAYELGGAGLREFKEMLLAVYQSRWAPAAAAMLDSLWAREVPTRAKMDADMMLDGAWPTV